jgi:hypothetical protein
MRALFKNALDFIKEFRSQDAFMLTLIDSIFMGNESFN